MKFHWERYVAGHMKVQDIYRTCSVRVRGCLRCFAEITIYILDNDSAVLYLCPFQHFGFVSWTCILLPGTGVKTIWVNGEGEWYIGFDLCMPQKSERFLLPLDTYTCDCCSYPHIKQGKAQRIPKTKRVNFYIFEFAPTPDPRTGLCGL